MDFGTCLRDWRLARNLTQRELARRATMDFTYLSRIEAGAVLPPSEEKIRALAVALGCTPNDTLTLLNLARDTKPSTEVINAALIRHPEVGALLRRIKDQPLSTAEADAIKKMAERGSAGSPADGENDDTAEPGVHS